MQSLHFQTNWVKKQLQDAPHVLKGCEEKTLEVLESCKYFVEAVHLATNFAEHASAQGRRRMIECLR